MPGANATKKIPHCETNWIFPSSNRVDQGEFHQRHENEDCACEEPDVNVFHILYAGHFVIDILVEVDKS